MSTSELPNRLPPLTAFALRHRMVRPMGTRKIAGVAAGLARATDTDPVFWRVLMAVLAVFGGIGLLAYAVCWLIMPGEEDQVAPLEAMFGRGRSATPWPMTLLLSIAALALVLILINTGLRFTLVIAGLVTLLAILLARRSPREATDPEVPPGTAFRTEPAPPMAEDPTVPQPAKPGYQPPFAPHGPYAPATAAPTGTGEIPLYTWEPTTGPPPPPPPQRQPRERSLLGRLTLLACCTALAVLVMLSTAGLDVPVEAYFGVLLAVVGAGLFIGAWRGRARWLIPIGVVFALCLPVAHFSDGDPMQHAWHGGQSQVAQDSNPTPNSIDEVQSAYSNDIGDITLDLSNVDFTGQSRTVSIADSAGDVTVIVPANVDTTVEANVSAGNATLFEQTFDGDPGASATYTDLGADGKGGGMLKLDIIDHLGDVEVTRS